MQGEKGGNIAYLPPVPTLVIRALCLITPVLSTVFRSLKQATPWHGTDLFFFFLIIVYLLVHKNQINGNNDTNGNTLSLH